MKRPIRPPGHLTQAAYARHRGCDPREVRRAIKAGRIILERSGYIDPAKADASWAESVNPASNSRPGDRTGESTLSRKGGGGRSTFVDARTRSELAKAAMAELRVKEKQGELLSSRFAADAAFAFARQFRERLQGWPARISALMANELGIDAHLLEVALDRHIRDLLQSMATDVNTEAFVAKLTRAKEPAQ